MKRHLLVEEVENVKIRFSSHNFATDLGGATKTLEAQYRDKINICTKYGVDSFIISGSYAGHIRHMTDNGRRTTKGVWHKLPTGDLIIQASQHYLDVSVVHLPLRIIQSCKKWLLILKKDF